MRHPTNAYLGFRLVKVPTGFEFNNAPIAFDDLSSTHVNQPIWLDVLANDTDEDNDALEIKSISHISGGTAEIVSDSSAIKITPSTGSYETISLRYTITDNKLGYAQAYARVAVVENLETYVDPNFSIEMVKISSGVFSMGSPNSEIDRNSNEGPQHPVTISKDFYMGKYELTQGQWANIVEVTTRGQTVTHRVLMELVLRILLI